MIASINLYAYESIGQVANNAADIAPMNFQPNSNAFVDSIIVLDSIVLFVPHRSSSISLIQLNYNNFVLCLNVWKIQDGSNAFEH